MVSKLKPLTGVNFIALFEERYEGYSFLLPLAVGLLAPNFWENSALAETFTFIREHLSEKPYKEINFFFGTPVAFAFGLSAAFGHYARGGIYSFYRDKEPYYLEVLRLKEIEKVR
ncbi:MAG TPA: hypothetical protein EYH48_04460 [Aquifex aeolicus]|uniref:SMODS-associated and fused to various effectors domain-containing protein n=1 Tax=Aquifex aeolicus TaxID=63363 RepID=A0A9D1CER5_AQUAO|nr:hypothetical protein [Aquificales bacterium]HIP98155.1 hypothetical protein [Aquifex aeolicus]HIQ26562.1 hypothetical protein [Aquifex aeolicus]